MSGKTLDSTAFNSLVLLCGHRLLGECFLSLVDKSTVHSDVVPTVADLELAFRDGLPDVLVVFDEHGSVRTDTVLGQVQRRWPALRCVVAVRRAGVAARRWALRADVAGVICLDDSPEAVSDELHQFVSGTKANPSTSPAVGGSAASTLTAKEIEVLRLVALGASTKESSALLGLSSRTIDARRRNLQAKLNKRSVVELTKYSIREGLIGVDAIDHRARRLTAVLA